MGNLTKNESATCGYLLRVGEIELTVYKKKIKNINLYVKNPDGRVVITAPVRTANSTIEHFVRKKYDWILAHQERIRQSQQQKTSEPVIISEKDKAVLYQKVLELAAKWEPVMGVHCNKFSIRTMKTRWGSCSIYKKTIRINALLVLKPEKCLELIVVHELTHLLEPSHNARFYALMTHFLPDWKERDIQLKEKVDSFVQV